MLEELHIRDLALIEEVWLEFGPGMTVLTGETGAGKSALLGGLKLLLGDRADSGAVRSGAQEALVEGRFSIDGVEVVARRRTGAEGRSRCTLDGEMATVGALAQRLGPTVDLHGQHDHQALLSAATHGAYLDRWADQAVGGALNEYRAARSRWTEAVRERDVVAHRVADAASDSDHLRFVVSEIDRVDPQPDEDELLQSRLPALQHAERLAEAAAQVAESLRGEGGAFDSVARAREALTRVSGIDASIDDLGERLSEIEALVDDAGFSARAYGESIDHDPASLESVLGRLGELGGLIKKYGPTLDAVLRLRESARASLVMVESGDVALAAANTALTAAEGALRDSAATLDQARRAAAPGFTTALAAATTDLAMEGARFEVAFHEAPFASWTTDGPARIEFLFSATPAQTPRPLVRIGSGGEISRVMLALKSVLGAADTVSTLVFDEIDAGIGGATATAVGARLALLARTHQVVVVTHLAQVAAYGDSHLVVSRLTHDDDVVTRVLPAVGEDRVLEIARMLSGNDSQAGRAHAEELLEEARRAVTAR